MSQNYPETLGREVGKRLVRVTIAVVGLLVIRLVLDALPMLKDANPIVIGSSISQAQAAEAAQGMAERYKDMLSANPYSASDMQKAAQEIAKTYSSGAGNISQAVQILPKE